MLNLLVGFHSGKLYNKQGHEDSFNVMGDNYLYEGRLIFMVMSFWSPTDPMSLVKKKVGA